MCNFEVRFIQYGFLLSLFVQTTYLLVYLLTSLLKSGIDCVFLVFCSHVLKENKTFTRSSVTRTTKNHSEAGCLTGGLTISFIKVSLALYGSVMQGFCNIRLIE